MNRIEHIASPERLLLVWRSPNLSGNRTRRVVAEIVQKGENVYFRYLRDTPDFIQAREEGFTGYPAFDIKVDVHEFNVLDSFTRRLPPRKREDFHAYLSRHRLSDHMDLSDMSLLAYTNAKLPSDGFEIYPDLSGARPPFELVIEVAGFRHQSGASIDNLYVGDPVILKPEPDNVSDRNAIAVIHSGAKIGYVDRAQAPSFLAWLRRGYQVNVVIERINGKPERPLVYLFVSVR